MAEVKAKAVAKPTVKKKTTSKAEDTLTVKSAGTKVEAESTKEVIKAMKEEAKEVAKEVVKKVVKRETKSSKKNIVVKDKVFLEFEGKTYLKDDLVKTAKDIWKYDLKKKISELVEIELYVKPEEKRVYYVMNKEETGSFPI